MIRVLRGALLRKHSIDIDLRPLAARLQAVGDDEALMARIIAEEVGNLSDAASQDMADVIAKEVDRDARRKAKFHQGYEKRLGEIWSRPLALYDVILSMCLEIGSDLNTTCRSESNGTGEAKLEALTRLHGRACLTGSEVGALLRSGHPTGANARWRTLHELAVVAMLLSEKEEDLARRYLEHEAIARARAMRQYQRFAKRLGAVPFTPEEVRQTELLREQLIHKYGGQFESDYGWAAKELGKKRPTFSDLASAIDLEHWAPYTRLASEGIHASSRASFFDLGLAPGLDVIPAGPSQFGLADPGANALISLHQVTAALMVYCIGRSLRTAEDALEEAFRAEIVLLIEMKALQVLVQETDESFVEVQRKLESLTPYRREAPRVLDIS